MSASFSIRLLTGQVQFLLYWEEDPFWQIFNSLFYLFFYFIRQSSVFYLTNCGHKKSWEKSQKTNNLSKWKITQVLLIIVIFFYHKPLNQAWILTIFHGPGHIWPGFFQCLQLKMSYTEKFWENCIHICFASGFSPYNDAFFTYYRKSTKKPKSWVIWDLDLEILPP